MRQRRLAQLERLGNFIVMAYRGQQPATAFFLSQEGWHRDHRSEADARGRSRPCFKASRLRPSVMMIGERIQRRPALAPAHVALRWGPARCFGARDPADAADFARTEVTDVPPKSGLARATMGQYSGRTLPLALGLKRAYSLFTTMLGVTGLRIAVLADTGATVLVTLNALRSCCSSGQPLLMGWPNPPAALQTYNNHMF